MVVAAVACAWAWQLQEQLQQANHTMVRYERRISDLEARLSDTDEGLNQSSAAMAVKIKESNSEIRKLWDSRKKANNTMAAVDRRGRANTKKGEATAKSLATTAESLAAVRGQLATAAGDIAKLKSVAGDLERLMASAKVNQAEVERVADDLNRIKLSLAKTDKRVRSNEEWVESINAFRRQINKTVSDIQAGLVTLQKPVGQN
ncbi:MAG: hypothetical protein HOC23_18770 [Halieaceae bacterium]|nr:hypothetical protein [Halieaceae bacterium]